MLPLYPILKVLVIISGNQYKKGSLIIGELIVIYY